MCGSGLYKPKYFIWLNIVYWSALYNFCFLNLNLFIHKIFIQDIQIKTEKFNGELSTKCQYN